MKIAITNYYGCGRDMWEALDEAAAAGRAEAQAAVEAQAAGAALLADPRWNGTPEECGAILRAYHAAGAAVSIALGAAVEFAHGT